METLTQDALNFLHFIRLDMMLVCKTSQFQIKITEQTKTITMNTGTLLKFWSIISKSWDRHKFHKQTKPHRPETEAKLTEIKKSWMDCKR